MAASKHDSKFRKLVRDSGKVSFIWQGCKFVQKVLSQLKAGDLVEVYWEGPDNARVFKVACADRGILETSSHWHQAGAVGKFTPLELEAAQAHLEEKKAEQHKVVLVGTGVRDTRDDLDYAASDSGASRYGTGRLYRFSDVEALTSFRALCVSKRKVTYDINDDNGYYFLFVSG